MFQRTLLTTSIQLCGAYGARTSILSTSRHFHASPAVAKTATEKVTEVADKVNKSVGQGLASAIETGEQVTEKTKETLGSAKERAMGGATSAAEKTKETSRAATGKASDMVSEAKKEREAMDEKH